MWSVSTKNSKGIFRSGGILHPLLAAVVDCLHNFSQSANSHSIGHSSTKKERLHIKRCHKRNKMILFTLKMLVYENCDCALGALGLFIVQFLVLNIMRNRMDQYKGFNRSQAHSSFE